MIEPTEQSAGQIQLLDIYVDTPIPVDHIPTNVKNKIVEGMTTVLVRAEVLVKMREHAATEPHREIAGVLIGQVYQHANVLWLQVTDLIPALYSRRGHTYVAITCEDWLQIDQTVQTDFSTERIVGWYHSHPGFGVFLSGADRFIHRTLFDLSWHIALVIDPQSSDLRLFCWQNGDITEHVFHLLE